MISMRLSLTLWVAVMGLFLAGSRVEPASYSFTKIVDTSGLFRAFGGEPSINAAGTVAFQGEYKAGGEGVFSGRGGSLTIIADSNGPLNGFGGITSINVHGTVAFRATFDTGGDGIFKGDGGPITTIADASGPFASFITDGPWINDNGAVAFFATLDTGAEGIFVGSGGLVTTIADATGGFASFEIYPSINTQGMVTFLATFHEDGEGIFIGNGGPLTTIADTSDPFASFGNRLSIDDAGMVTFSATLDAGGSGFFIGDGGPVTQIPDPEMAFRAIIQSSALFSGATVLHSPTQGRNASGQYAFFARFADGTEAIYRADPVVPFAAFTATVKIALGHRANDDTVEVNATFTLGSASNGINPVTEPLTIQVGPFARTIPAGSFQQDKKGRFAFKGTINEVSLDVQITPLNSNAFAFNAKGKDADLTGTVNPMTVGLTIGDDTGSVSVTAEFK